MNKIGKMMLGVLLLLAVAAAGYWLGTRSTSAGKEMAGTAKTERKVLYYRNPMGLPDTSPEPKKDSMGMDYIPVYEGEDKSSNQLSISTDKVQKLGVKSEAAAMRDLNSVLRVVGRIEVNERRTYTIAPKFEGWVERLYVNTTGQTVSKGQPLFDVYSPELVSAQREHTLAKQGVAALKNADQEARAGMNALLESSRQRLQNWDISDQATRSGTGQSRVTFRAPVTGVVLEKKAVQGMRFMPGEMLYQIADLASVWIIAEVNEQDIGRVKLGSEVQASLEAYPQDRFPGKVDFIYPTLNSMSRTVQVRIEMANPKGLLKPAMFANVLIDAGQRGKVLAVPSSAVIDSGKRQVVLVRLAEGRFEPRTVSLGQRSDDYVEVLSGVMAGEQVVTAANFLIDAESNIKAALSGLSGENAPAEMPMNAQSDLAEAGGHTGHGQAEAQPKMVGHQVHGVLDEINTDGSVSITHEPVASLGWPGMTMDFKLSNASLLEGVKPDSMVNFEIVERAPGEWVITKLQAHPANGEH